MYIVAYNVIGLLFIRTLKIRFGQKMNEIAKFNIADEKTNFDPLDKNAKQIREIRLRAQKIREIIL